MTKEEYLDMRGFSNEDYALMTKEEIGDLSTKSGAMNNMYAANDPKGKLFGAGAYVVKRSWAKENMSDAPKIEEAVTENIPVAPAVPSPPPVPIPPVTESAKEVDELPSHIKVRIGNLVSKGWMVHKDSVQSKDVIISFKKLGEMTNEEYTSLIIVKQPEPTIEEEVKDFLCLNNVQSNQDRCKDQCGYCETQDVAPSEEATEAIKTIEAETAEEIETAEIEAIEAESKEEAFEKTILEEKLKQTEFKKIQEIADASPNIHIVGMPKIDPVEPEEAKEVLEIVGSIDLTDEENIRKAKAGEPIKISDGFIPGIKDEMTTGDLAGYFSQLAILGFQQLNFAVNKVAEGKFTVIIKPEPFSEEPISDNILPWILEGPSDDIKEHLSVAMFNPKENTLPLINSVKEFLKTFEQEKKVVEKPLKKKAKAKSAEKEEKEKPKEPVPVNIPIPVASEKVAKAFSVLDEVIETANRFKQTFFLMATIKEVLIADLTNEEKLNHINNLIDENDR